MRKENASYEKQNQRTSIQQGGSGITDPNDLTPTYIPASTLSELVSGEQLTIAFGKLAKAVKDLIAHIGNKGNPHSVTKSQVGLENVDNTADKDKVVKEAGTVNGHTVKADVPADAKFTDTVYTHPNSGVTAGTYKSVTVNAQGHVTAGSNPTTLAGYGITDAESKGTASGTVNAHNTSTAAHGDIRELIAGLTSRLNVLANSDDETLDQMAEVVAYIKANRSLIESITTNKVNVDDIINNLTTNVSNKPLSAAQGVALKTLIDTLQTAVDGKVDKVDGKGLSTNDYTTEEKTKLAGIAEGANKTVVDSALSSSSTNPVQNKVVNAALGGKAVIVQLANDADLNNVKTAGFYSCDSGNSVANKPSGVAHFGLFVVRRASGEYYVQIIFTDATSYRRYCVNGTWGAWKEENLADLNTMINGLSIDTSAPADADYYVCQHVGGGTTTTTYHRRPMSALWSWTKAKLSEVAISGSYNDLSGTPTIGNGTIQIKQAGTAKGSFSVNQTGGATIELTDTNTWRGVQDNLTSDSATESLSAKQGKVLDGKFASYLPLSGGKMTGQLKTSFKDAVAMGSFAASSLTVTDLVDELRFSSGAMGSVCIDSAYTNGENTIPIGWYNFFYSPHRYGGVNGTASRDNCSYGTLLLTGMTVNNGNWRIRVSSSVISEVAKIVDTSYIQNASNLNAAANKIAVLSDAGGLHFRTPEQLRSDMGAAAAEGAGAVIYMATLTASGWTGSAAPYEQTISVSGITADMEPIVLAYKTTNMTMTESKAYDKAFSILCAGAAETQAGTVRWKCFEKPATDITVVLMEI